MTFPGNPKLPVDCTTNNPPLSLQSSSSVKIDRPAPGGLDAGRTASTYSSERIPSSRSLPRHQQSHPAGHHQQGHHRPAGHHQPQSSGSPRSQRWVPPSAAAHADDKSGNPEQAKRRVRAILNKLTPDKFDKLCNELVQVGIESKDLLKTVILLIFDKALDEPNYSSMYAQLCVRLNDEVGTFDNPSGNPSKTVFRRLLLAKCRDEFENRTKASADYDARDQLSPEEEEARADAKRKMLGNIRFIGELAKLDMLAESILHRCVQQLLETKRVIADQAENSECLCNLLKTIGAKMDTEKAKGLMDQYFSRIEQFSKNEERLPPRNRFMLLELIELRANLWRPRRVVAEAQPAPRTISEVREEAYREFGYRGHMPRGGGNRGHSNSPAHGGGSGPSDFMAGNDFGQNQGHSIFRPDFVSANQSSGNSYSQSGGWSHGNGPPLSDREEMLRGTLFDIESVSASPGLTNVDRHGAPLPHPAVVAANAGRGRGQNSPRIMPTVTMKNDEELSLRPSRPAGVGGRPPAAGGAAGRVGSGGNPMASPANAGRGGAPQGVDAHGRPMAGAVSSITGTGSSRGATSPAVMPAPSVVKKKTKSKKPSRKELQKLTISMLDEYVSVQDDKEALLCVEEMAAPYFADELVLIILNQTIESQSDKRTIACNLLSKLHAADYISVANFVQAFEDLLNRRAELIIDVPKVDQYISEYPSHGLASGWLKLTDIMKAFVDGKNFPIFFHIVSSLSSLTSKECVKEEVAALKTPLLTMMPETKRTVDNLFDILESLNVSFILPLHEVRGGLRERLSADDVDGMAVAEWLKSAADDELRRSDEFIMMVMFCVLRAVTSRFSLCEGVDPTVALDKTAAESEKAFFSKLQNIIQSSVQDNSSLQLSLIFALQAFCYQHDFPRGMLLRFFVSLYELDLVEEEVFISWKEDTKSNVPGKGKALFQVNNWLTWLQNAEEESESD
ncbi:eukaryotic translation initiation factor 4 gamma 2-like [Sycon ciliatum]|uniref:eukaryotic translation initiation factor 4 gamma 2-like n=1 Tax=Sycon ciliatum TaxID=27933 RepID=UPI0020AE4896|eukprot:scpid23199/ scgid29163/ Eukaryotic translation initiation factor 4 gamma 2; Death-associated protein 5; p97 &gt; Eukaryotic translation initiation factor 4 gamma 2; p97 &gt; Eukaryotic translation initiation factor 4 gamma 2